MFTQALAQEQLIKILFQKKNKIIDIDSCWTAVSCISFQMY